MKQENKKCELILALDLESLKEIKVILYTVGDNIEWVKIGLQLFLRYGPSVVETIASMGYRVFLDLKLHDIPNTVASAIKSLENLPIHMLTLHASGGTEMLKWAVAARNETNPKLKLLGVTVLTSMDTPSLQEVLGSAIAPKEQVLRLAKLNTAAGIDGLVCSPLEISAIRKTLGDNPLLVTPGIRPKGNSTDEQKRVMTPLEAANAGSNFIVVGRPILRAEDPEAVIQSILKEIAL